MSAEYQSNLSFVSYIPAEFLKLREYSANPDISWIFLSASRNLKKNSAEGSGTNGNVAYRDNVTVTSHLSWNEPFAAAKVALVRRHIAVNVVQFCILRPIHYTALYRDHLQHSIAVV